MIVLLYWFAETVGLIRYRCYTTLAQLPDKLPNHRLYSLQCNRNHCTNSFHRRAAKRFMGKKSSISVSKIEMDLIRGNLLVLYSDFSFLANFLWCYEMTSELQENEFSAPFKFRLGTKTVTGQLVKILVLGCSINENPNLTWIRRMEALKLNVPAIVWSIEEIGTWGWR